MLALAQTLNRNQVFGFHSIIIHKWVTVILRRIIARKEMNIGTIGRWKLSKNQSILCGPQGMERIWSIGLPQSWRKRKLTNIR